MTLRRRDSKPPSPFSAWTRERKALESRQGMFLLDIDWVWERLKEVRDKRGVRYRSHLIMIEEKPRGAEVTASQWDTLCKLGELLNGLLDRKTNRQNGKVRAMDVYSTFKGKYISTRLWGPYVLRYEGDDFERAKWHTWQKAVSGTVPRYVCPRTIEKILRVDINPDTLEPYVEDRRHHAAARLPLLDFLEGIG